MDEKKVELEILPNGEIRMMYSDETVPKVAEMIGAQVVDVPRASNVEFERTEFGNGWTVRAAHDPELAIRLRKNFILIVHDSISPEDIVVSKEGRIFPFSSREDAILSEIEHFWELLPPGAACAIPKKSFIHDMHPYDLATGNNACRHTEPGECVCAWRCDE